MSAVQPQQLHGRLHGSLLHDGRLNHQIGRHPKPDMGPDRLVEHSETINQPAFRALSLDNADRTSENRQTKYVGPFDGLLLSHDVSPAAPHAQGAFHHRTVTGHNKYFASRSLIPLCDASVPKTEQLHLTHLDDFSFVGVTSDDKATTVSHAPGTRTVVANLSVSPAPSGETAAATDLFHRQRLAVADNSRRIS